MSNARNLARLLPNASGQLPDAAMSSGSVIQVVTAQNTNAVTISADGVIDIGISASITIQQGSRILVDCVVPVYSDGSGGGSWAATQVFLYEGATMLIQTEHAGTVTNEAQSVQIPLNGELTARNAGTYTFALKACRTIGGSRYIKRDNRLGVMKLTEIAA